MATTRWLGRKSCLPVANSNGQTGKLTGKLTADVGGAWKPQLGVPKGWAEAREAATRRKTTTRRRQDRRIAYYHIMYITLCILPPIYITPPDAWPSPFIHSRIVIVMWRPALHYCSLSSLAPSFPLPTPRDTSNGCSLCPCSAPIFACRPHRTRLSPL